MWWIVAAAALAVATISLWGLLPRHQPPVIIVAGTSPVPTTPVRRAPSSVPTTPVGSGRNAVPMTPVRSAAQPVASSRPVELSIPSIGVSTRLGEVGLQADRQVQVPASTAYASWFNLGPTPGQIGSSVILGHVDSYRGPGVFFRLRSLAVGASVNVTLADGVRTTFAVTGVVQYSKNDFPDALVYASRGVRALQLVTCGGAFDHQTGHYESNIVVFTRLRHVTPRQSLPAA